MSATKNIKLIGFLFLLFLLWRPDFSDAAEYRNGKVMPYSIMARTDRIDGYLTPGEAARTVGWFLHQNYENVLVGSLEARCPRRPNPRLRWCAYAVADQAGVIYCGTARVRETRAGWRIWMPRDPEGC